MQECMVLLHHALIPLTSRLSLGFFRLRVALRALATPRQARTKVCGDFPQIDPIIVFSTLCAFQVGMNVLDSAAQPQ